MTEADAVITAETIRNKFIGKTEKPRSLIDIFKEHNKKVEALIGKEFTKGTLCRYKTSLKHTKDFLKWKYDLSDIDIKLIDHAFIMEYEFYLRSVRKCANNSAVKYIKNFGKIIRICLANRWLIYNPFLNYKNKIKTVDRVYLTTEELQEMANKELATDRLTQVRDIFLFCCFTGLAYADVKKLRRWRYLEKSMPQNKPSYKLSAYHMEDQLMPDELIMNRIYLIRGRKVMLDKDLAELYQVTTGNLNKAVARNLMRFPSDFLFRLTDEEFKNLLFQNGRASWGGRRQAPNAFTEEGVAMLSGVLSSDRAIAVNIQIMRIFTRIRQILADNTDLRLEIEKIKNKLDNQDKNMEVVFRYLDELIEKKDSPQPPRKRIGFKSDDL